MRWQLEVYFLVLEVRKFLADGNDNHQRLLSSQNRFTPKFARCLCLVIIVSVKKNGLLRAQNSCACRGQRTTRCNSHKILLLTDVMHALSTVVDRSREVKHEKLV